MLQNAYNKVDVSSKFDLNDVQDNMGFLGKSKWYREKVFNLLPMTDSEFLKVWAKEKKENGVFQAIR
jgi:hypothetical protein